MTKIGRFVKEYGWIGTAAAAVATGVWAVTAYLQTAKLEYIREFNAKQLDTIFQATAAVSGLVAEPDAGKWQMHQVAFWALHYGDMVLFENSEVECAMTYFGAKLKAVGFQGRQDLGPQAYAVSAALRKLVGDLNNNGWKINLSTLVEAKTEVSPLLGLKGDPTLQEPANYSALEKKIDAKCKKT